jgi:hypothetical protein
MPFLPAMTGKGKIYDLYHLLKWWFGWWLWDGLWNRFTHIMIYYDIFWLLSQSSPSGLSWIRNEKCLRPPFTKNSHSNLFRSSEMRYLLYGPIWTYMLFNQDLYRSIWIYMDLHGSICRPQSVQFNDFFNFRRLRISHFGRSPWVSPTNIDPPGLPQGPWCHASGLGQPIHWPPNKGPMINESMGHDQWS